MKLIIAGGRDYQFTQADWAKLDAMNSEKIVTEVVCGMARGADLCGKQWADARGIRVREFRPDYDRFLPGIAPLLRNTDMANYADALAFFPGGNGTADMAEKARARGLIIFDFSQPTTPVLSPGDQAMTFARTMTDGERIKFFEAFADEFCVHCGRSQPSSPSRRCQCWNDE